MAHPRLDLRGPVRVKKFGCQNSVTRIPGGAARDLSPKEMTMARRDTNGHANGSGGARKRPLRAEHGLRADVLS